MAVTASPTVRRDQAVERCERAAQELYRAELALHDAHQSRVDAWIKAAGDHLHAAVVRYMRARDALDRCDRSAAA